MCILTFVTRYCERFPFILIGNRDEQLGRGTRHLRYDVQTGLIWAVDQLAGGSWMGIEPRSGRFTILTNCRRAPAAPLTRPVRSEDNKPSNHTSTPHPVLSSSSSPQASAQAGGEGDVDWRGAAPLSHIRAHTNVVPVRPEVADAAHPHARTLRYNPPSSRGTIVKDFLLTGELPRMTSADDAPAPSQSPLTAPFYAGYNLISCDSLRTVSGQDEGRRGVAAPSVYYTTNRYAAEYRRPVAAGTVHALQNSFLDNTAGEPISMRLKELFTKALEDVIAPLDKSPTTAFSVTDVATKLVDACLCDRSHFNIAEMMHDGTSAETAAAICETVHSTNPLLGFSADELQSFCGANTTRREGDDGAAAAESATAAPFEFCDDGAALIEAYLQANILKTPVGGHGTRVQSMVLVERVPVVSASGESTTAFTEVIHFCQRDVSFEDETQTCVGSPWISFRINADGSFARESE